MPMIALLAMAILGPFASWGLTTFKARWFDTPRAVAAAVETERANAAIAFKAEQSRATRQCDARVATLEQAAKDAADAAREAADEAERAVGVTPVEAAELADLCNRSASCRDRKKGGR